MTSTTRLARQVMAQFAPPPEQTVSQWADAERRLSPESSAEPGQFRVYYGRSIHRSPQPSEGGTR